VPYTETSLLASYAQALGHLAAVGSELAIPVAASKAVPVPNSVDRPDRFSRVPARCQ